jgi:hypothetical protein
LYFYTDIKSFTFIKKRILMIKKHLFLLILSTIFNVLHAQDEKKIKLEFGEESKLENTGTSVVAMMKDKTGNIYCVKDKPSGFVIGTGFSDASIGSVKHKFFLEIFSPTLKKLLSKEVEIPNAQAKIFVTHNEWGSGIIRGLTINDEPYLFITYVEKKSKTRLIQATKINLDGTFDTPTPLCELSNEGTDYSRSYIVCQSKDNSKIMIVGVPDVKAKQNIQYYISVFNNNFEQIWSRGFALPIKEKRNIGANFYVGNTGRMYMQTYEEITKKVNKDDADVRVAFYTFAKKDFDLKELIFSLPKERYLQFEFIADLSDETVTCLAPFTKDIKPKGYRNSDNSTNLDGFKIEGINTSTIKLSSSEISQKQILFNKSTTDYFKPNDKKSKRESGLICFYDYNPLLQLKTPFSNEIIKKIDINKTNGDLIITIIVYEIAINMVLDNALNKVSETYVDCTQNRLNHFINDKGQSVITISEGYAPKAITKCYVFDRDGQKKSSKLTENGKNIEETRLYNSKFRDSNNSLIFSLQDGKKYKLMRLKVE